MTFQQLQYFLEVHRTGSVTKAAKNLYVSYPSVSVAIANIEKELGIVLFSRGPKGLSLTEQGKQVLEYANTITQAYMQMNDLRQEGRRAIRINAGDYETIATAFAKLIEEYGTDYNTDIMMTTCNSDDSFRLLVTGEIAVSILAYMSYNVDNIEHRIKRDGLESEDLIRIPLAVCLGKKHRLYNAQHLTAQDLRGETAMVSYSKSLPWHTVFRLTEPKRILRVSSPNARRELARRGLAYYVCFMPPKAERERSDRRFIPLEDIHYRVTAVTNPQRAKEPEVVRFLELLKEQIAIDYPDL
ncbi:MAG: LysR family transcriptional regulator [Oscillospiraceae bacterium]|nr:LysR family transcriptional regulator [Oscillospiraceae bacterium]